MIKSLAFPEYAPDQTINSGVLVRAEGVFPQADGYGPLKAFQSISDALPADFTGGDSFVAGDGSSYLLVGTSSGLVRYSAGGWTVLVTGLTLSEPWRFVQFGDNVVGVNGSATYEVDLVAGTAALLTGAPAGKSVAVVGDYVVIGQDASKLLSVFTSDVNNHTRWVPDEGATEQPMPTGGEVMGLAGGEYGVILQRRRLVRMDRTGDAALPFEYNEISSNVGAASRRAIAQHGRSVFFLSDQGFMALEDGQQLVPIGSERVDRTFQSIVKPGEYENVSAAIDPQRKLVLWSVPGSPGSLWIYNYELNRWAVSFTFNLDGIFAGFTSSQTLEGLDADNPSIDAMTVSLDDPRFSGGSPQFYVVQGGRVGSLSGSNLAADIETGFFRFGGDRVSRIRKVRPITDAISGQTLTIDTRARLGDEIGASTAGPIRQSGVLPVRASGRFSKSEWSIAAGSNWTYAQGLEFEYERGGAR